MVQAGYKSRRTRSVLLQFPSLLFTDRPRTVGDMMVCANWLVVLTCSTNMYYSGYGRWMIIALHLLQSFVFFST